ncbi:nuclear transport factor 2 family protein [Gracilibacillus sp. D59]|uniref:nuclear transport factor 2 family protein n=1 Tax=Gracilibacillus sp. D59 TaxID=3457434 RepID=UPI003FCCCF5B
MINNLKVHLQELEESHLQLDVRNDSKKLAQILADDFHEFGSSGILIDKKMCLEHGINLDDMTLHNYQIDQLASDVVLATYYVINKTKNRNTLRSSIWKHIDGRWQLSFHQGTITKLSLENLE